MLYEVLARASSKIASTVPCKRTCTGFSVRRLDVSRSFKWQSRFQDFWNAHRLNLHPLVVFDNDKVDQNTLFATILQLFSRFFIFHISSVISPSERHCHPSAVGEGLFSSQCFEFCRTCQCQLCQCYSMILQLYDMKWYYECNVPHYCTYYIAYYCTTTPDLLSWNALDVDFLHVTGLSLMPCGCSYCRSLLVGSTALRTRWA